MLKRALVNEYSFTTLFGENIKVSRKFWKVVSFLERRRLTMKTLPYLTLITNSN